MNYYICVFICKDKAISLPTLLAPPVINMVLLFMIHYQIYNIWTIKISNKFAYTYL